MAANDRYLPVFIDVAGARVLVVGAGRVAGRRALGLLARGARVTVVAPGAGEIVAGAEARGDLTLLRRPFEAGDLDGADLVFAATGDARVNAAVADGCRRRAIPVNVADDPARCTFIMPAVSEGEGFTLAVSTSGKNPGAARAIREFLDDHAREISVRLERGRRRKAAGPKGGMVHIVGAGPGDPDLLTVRALGLIRSADVVIHDYLVPESILSLAPERVPRICFARRGATVGHGAAIKQAAIHEAMVRLAREGKAVVRLKSGDPLVFGRGGEEAEHLAAEGIPFEIVPGITAAAGCAAAAGVALTHRTRASSVTFLAGHEAEGKAAAGAEDMGAIPKDGTLAIYMGVRRAGAIAAALAEAGWPAGTPFTIVENGCRPGQRVFAGTIGALAEVVAREKIRSPAILFVGQSAVPVALPAEGGTGTGTGGIG
jgi:uroporphyrin-III C-methyltransferase/precorrin-2 dehydrogenase/sirohydrochlorin ferrochelatase